MTRYPVTISHPLAATDNHPMTNILLEGYTADEILALPDQMLDGLVLSGETLVFNVGSAEILGKFRVADDTLVLELGHVDGGGEGALPAISALAHRYAMREKLCWLEWQVHAVHCARPNLKLRRVLERRGFVVRDIAGIGGCYWLRKAVDAPTVSTASITVDFR